jgi:hypothetical protein
VLDFWVIDFWYPSLKFESSLTIGAHVRPAGFLESVDLDAHHPRLNDPSFKPS